MVTINLLPIKAELRRKALISQLAVLGISIIALVVVLGAFHETLKIRRDNLQQEITDTRIEIQKLTVQAGEIEVFKKRKQELERKLDIIKDLNAKKSGPVQMLDELSTLMPEKVWIRSLSNTGGKLVLDGLAVDNTVIAEFMKKLQGSQQFGDVELILTEQEGANVKFVIQCKVKLPA
ncbi:MAG: PilN domain-containing protein [Syntrophaceae bacterium]